MLQAALASGAATAAGGLRGLHPAAAARAALRGLRRRRAAARRVRGLPLRTGRDRRCCARRGVVDAATARVARATQVGTPPKVDIVGLAEGEAYGPDTPVLVVEGTLRRGRPAGDAGALGPQPRQRRRRRRSPDDRAPPATGPASRWARGAPTSRPPSPPPGPPTSSGFEATSNLEAGRRYDIPTTGTSAHAFTLAHDDRAGRLRGAGRVARRRHDAAGRHLRRDGGGAHRGRGRRARSSARSGSTAATSGRWPARSAQLLDSLGATEHPHHRHQRPRRVRDRRARRGAGRRLRRRHAPGHRIGRADRRLRLQARRARRPPGREALAGQALPRRPQDAWPAGSTRTGRRVEPTWSCPAASRRSARDLRPLHEPLVRAGERSRRRRASPRRGSGGCSRGPNCPRRRCGCPRGEPALPRELRGLLSQPRVRLRRGSAVSSACA